jgi:hypothetical protein
VRYIKDSVVMNPKRDIALLRQVRNARFIRHDQLFALLHYTRSEASRSSFNWRLRRLLACGYIHVCGDVCRAGFPVYRITQDGLLQLESHGHFATALHSATQHPPHKSQVFHALGLNSVQVALAQKDLLAHWQSDIEIASSNMVSRSPYQKDYDAIVDVWIDGKIRRFGLEYERSLKSAKQYDKVRAALASEGYVGCVLYLAAGQDMVLHLTHELAPASGRVAFATLDRFCERLMDTEVYTSPDQPPTTFGAHLLYRGLPFPGAA